MRADVKRVGTHGRRMAFGQVVQGGGTQMSPMKCLTAPRIAQLGGRQGKGKPESVHEAISPEECAEDLVEYQATRGGAMATVHTVQSARFIGVDMHKRMSWPGAVNRASTSGATAQETHPGAVRSWYQKRSCRAMCGNRGQRNAWHVYDQLTAPEQRCSWPIPVGEVDRFGPGQDRRPRQRQAGQIVGRRDSCPRFGCRPNRCPPYVCWWPTATLDRQRTRRATGSRACCRRHNWLPPAGATYLHLNNTAGGKRLQLTAPERLLVSQDLRMLDQVAPLMDGGGVPSLSAEHLRTLVRARRPT